MENENCWCQSELVCRPCAEKARSIPTAKYGVFCETNCKGTFPLASEPLTKEEIEKLIRQNDYQYDNGDRTGILKIWGGSEVIAIDKNGEKFHIRKAWYRIE